MNQRIAGHADIFHAGGTLRVRETASFLASVAETWDGFDLGCETTEAGALVLMAGIGTIELLPGAGHVEIRISGPNEGALFMLRETVEAVVGTVEPGSVADLDWSGTARHGALPPNFRLARIEDVAPIGKRFWRLTIRARDLAAFARDGLHLRLALPARGMPARWPVLNGTGRAEWPPADRLHVAVYTIREIDPAAGIIVIDIFRHAGGRTSDWMELAQPGEIVGLLGPGGGWFPEVAHLVLAGDETALPAIARMLEAAGPETTGTAILEMENRGDYPLPAVPQGVDLRVVERSAGEGIEAALGEADLGPEGARHVWVAVEKGRAAAIRAHLRVRRGLGRRESCVSGYWSRD
ncbi:siderophore-interacting protein [Palleronia sp. LCG004]|uniref:siderophore-interacting protein n=1 Tax=Palleronia sp. LCG004 TaxID=3079304 RepID=UPI002942E40F|nr:siderophore-interacting protein [Palleronia sp. LCG004]WOI58126.1 siderophore-interacting protein [Palleronia sp. LCG004]